MYLAVIFPEVLWKLYIYYVNNPILTNIDMTLYLHNVH